MSTFPASSEGLDSGSSASAPVSMWHLPHRGMKMQIDKGRQGESKPRRKDCMC